MKGKCINIDDNCPNFNKIVEVPDDQDFICPKCGHPLYEVEDSHKGGISKKVLAIVVAAIIVVISAVIILIASNRKEEPVNVNDKKGHVDLGDDTSGNGNGALSPEEKGGDTVYVELRGDTVYVKDTIEVDRDTVYVTEHDTVEIIKRLDTSRPTLTYSFGYYIGETSREGIPEGEGRMYYTTRTPIATHDLDKHFAENGDCFVGIWANGDIQSGTLFYQDGRMKEKLIVGKRPNPIDLEESFQKYLEISQ